MKYGEYPKTLLTHEVKCNEMMFYQYMPIKLSGQSSITMEERLQCFENLIGASCCDFIGMDGLDKFIESNVYLTVKHAYQQAGCSYNREGWHSDGFMTDDINYIWSDRFPTVFNLTPFNLTQCHEISLVEMNDQAKDLYNIHYSDCELLRLNQYNIHKVGEITEGEFRTFFKLSFSKDKYNLIGNTHNYMLDYEWEMKPREISRNHPSK